MFVKKLQWGTSVEVGNLPTKDPPKIENTKNIVNFSMLYFNQKPEINEKDIPKQIIVKYNDDYNILEIDIIIRRRLELIEKRDIDGLKAKIAEEEEKLKLPQTGIEYKQCIKNKSKYHQQLIILENRVDYENYIRESKEWIQRYKEIGVKKKKINFGSQTSDPTDEDDLYRQKIISKYLEIARNYIDVVIYKESNEYSFCMGCGEKLDHCLDDGGVKKCSKCGTERLYLNRSYFIADSDNQSSAFHNDYDDRETFYKSLLRFQGKQHNRVPNRLWSQLNKYFSSLGLLIGEKVKELETLPDGTKPKTSRNMMFKALQELGFNDCYEDIHLICNLYWGWSLPDISHLEDIIMRDYDLTQKVFEKIKKGKQSSLNAEYRLFKHLEIVGYPCNQDDFKIIKTRDTLENCENTWKKMCEGAGLPFIPTI